MRGQFAPVEEAEPFAEGDGGGGVVVGGGAEGARGEDGHCSVRVEVRRGGLGDSVWRIRWRGRGVEMGGWWD